MIDVQWSLPVVLRRQICYQSLTGIRVEHPVAGFVRIRCFDAERHDFEILLSW